ncbi:acylneuraminate cytidylyltransferase family protein [Solidesulfovibrio sp.]|uniref:acylneuraminate cytidylyltransferase family protein n=1 Tax=Solidesulfovibrio sp. TaxID=2910990 RepID=UPI0026043EC4|nr:acylneuraminate cytidylyltransferase family protein [Solidesulfovibrio sp.]
MAATEVGADRSPSPKEDDAFETLVLIPARGGSKGIRDKNIADLGGVPLLAHTIRTAQAARNVDRIVVSTESEGIRRVALEWGAEAPFLRPRELAEDHADMGDAIRHARLELAKDGYSPDAVVILLATSPFRSPGLVELAVDSLRRGYNHFTTVKECPMRPCDLLERDAAGRMRMLHPDADRRLFLRPYGLVTGQRLGKAGGKGNLMHRIGDPVACIDIDEPEDLELARRVLDAGLFRPCRP